MESIRATIELGCVLGVIASMMFIEPTGFYLLGMGCFTLLICLGDRE